MGLVILHVQLMGLDSQVAALIVERIMVKVIDVQPVPALHAHQLSMQILRVSASPVDHRCISKHVTVLAEVPPELLDVGKV